MDNQEEMDRFLKRYNIPKLNHEEIEDIKRPIIGTVIENEFKSLPKHKSWDLMATQANSIKHSEES